MVYSQIMGKGSTNVGDALGRYRVVDIHTRRHVICTMSCIYTPACPIPQCINKAYSLLDPGLTVNCLDIHSSFVLHHLNYSDVNHHGHVAWREPYLEVFLRLPRLPGIVSTAGTLSLQTRTHKLPQLRVVTSEYNRFHLAASPAREILGFTLRA